MIEQIGLSNLMYGTKEVTDVKAWRIQRGAIKELAILACDELDRRFADEG